MANIKTISFISGGVVIAFTAIIGMNIAASTKDNVKHEGGNSEQTLARGVPSSNASPFDLVADETEASRRAASNREIAYEAIDRAGGDLSYTTPPVIQLEGFPGDSSDPMGSELLVQEDHQEVPPPEVLAQASIEPVTPPVRNYKVPENQETVSEKVKTETSDISFSDMVFLRRLLENRMTGISIQTFSSPENKRVLMTLQEFKRSRAKQGGAAGLPVSRIPEPVTSIPQSGGVLRTISKDTPSSYIEGAIQDSLGNSTFATLLKEYDTKYDWRKSYQVAQSSIAIDNNSRIYDTARNAMAFDTGTLVMPGDQRFATLLYGFNSDDAAQLPVFAQLHDYGPASSAFLNGARLQGTLSLSTESALMEFNKLILKGGRVVPIKAMGISQDQLRVGVFENVDRHIISRYSSLLVSGLIQGVGDVGTQYLENKYAKPENVIIIGDGANQNSSSDDMFSKADRAAMAMGAVKPIGNVLASRANQGFNRPPTVTASAGFGFSIVFLEGLTFGQVQ